MPSFNIALHKKEQKEKRGKQVMKNRRIQELDEELRLLEEEEEEEIEKKEKSLRERRAQSRRLDRKADTNKVGLPHRLKSTELIEMNSHPNFEEFFSELIGCFIKDPQKVAFIKKRLSVMLYNLKTQATQSADTYVSKHLIPELSRLIKSSFGVSAEKQLMSLKPFVIRGLDIFLKEGRVLNKDEIIQMAKKRIPELIIETAIPNASENTKTLVRNTLNLDQKAGLPILEDFLSELVGCFIKDQQKVAFIKVRLSVMLSNMKTQAIQCADTYVTEHLIPKLSRLIKSCFGVSAVKQLMSLKPFVIRGLDTFLKEGRVLNKDEIIQLARKRIPELIIETVIPNASENTKSLVRNTLNLVQDAVFNFRPGTIPSVEELLQTLLKKCADKAFCIDRAQLSQAINKLIKMMPEKVDNIMEFLVRHVLRALSVCFEATAFALVKVFLKECFERLRKEGTVRIKGRDVAKPLAIKALQDVASQKIIKNTAEEVSTVVTETVLKSKVTHNVLKKCVVDKAGNKVVLETTKKVAAKTSKNVVTKVTQNASSKVASTASQSVKVSTKAVKSIGAKATRQGVQAAEKTVQKVSVKITKNVGDGISNGVAEVTKKAAVKKTVKSTLTETAESVTATTSTKVTKTSVSKTTHISQTSSKAAAEIGMKNAAKAGVTAAGISAVVGGVFLYRDLNNLDEQKEKGSLSETEYKKQKGERIGEFAGDVIGSGVVGAAVSLAALTGPAGWAAIGVGAIVSFATGKLGGQIGKALA